MRRIALAALGFALLLSAVPLFSQANVSTEKTLESNEKAGWQAWKDHDAKQAVAWFTNDSISIADGGVFKGKEQLVKSITDARCVVNSFSLSGVGLETHQGTLRDITLFVASLALTVLLASASYRFVELPFLRRK